MRIVGLLALLGMVAAWAGEMPEKAADYHAALAKRPDSAQLFERFRDAWLEERSVEELEKELLARAEGKEAGAWAILARAYLAAGRADDALAAFDKAREHSPATWLDLETAGLRLAAKDFAAAERAALAVPEGDPKRLDALKLAGLACLRAERIDDALVHWTKAVAAAPGDSGLLEDLTELTRREGRLDLALEYCGKWRDATNDAYGKAMATIRRSELLLGSQRFDEALAELAEVFRVAADDSWLEREALARAEQAHRQRGDATGWAKWIGAQADAHPARLNFRRAHSQALAAAGKTDEALEVLTEVMRRSPGDTTVRWLRIGLLEQSMKLAQAYEECAELAAKEKSETAGLRLAELAFRLEKKAELKQALDGVLAAVDSGKRVNLASLYARYGLPEGSEKIWREESGGEFGGSALRQLAKHLMTAGREQQAIEVWKQLGARDVAQDRIDSAQMLAAAGEKGAAREILESGREKLSAESGYEAAVADLAMVEGKPDAARAIYLKLARVSKQPDELAVAVKGWLRTSAAATDPLKDLGEETADRCLRAAWLAAAGKPLPAVLPGDELERSTRQALLREHGRWAEIVALMEAVPGERGPLLLSELAEAKLAAGNLPGALVTARAWRARVPDQPGPWLFEAGILEKLSKQADATVLLRRAAARFEDNEEVARRLFAVLLESLDPRESLEWAWKRHDRSNDESARSGWLREILLVSKQREKLDDLKERFEERARRDPASPGPLVALAELAKARGDSRAELDLLRRAAVNAPRDLAVISALAAQEERSGETARALERYVALARLAPGPDSARQLAQAKIRLGDVEGGIRDLQALTGEKGLDLRALEQSAGDLASRGYVEDATRLLAAVDPAQRTARLNFVLGMLLDTDGRESEAVDAFIKVMAEPDDPAEIRQRALHGYNNPSRSRQYSQMIQSYSGREESIPGTFNGLRVPESLTEARLFLKSLLARLAMQRGGEIWTRAATVIPELAAATPEQWRKAMEFARSDESGNSGNWWDFIEAHPGNPLGMEFLVESGHIYQSKPEQVEALLKTNPPVRVQVLLRLGRLGEGMWRADNLEFLESIQPADLQDESIRPHVWRAVEQMLILAAAGEVTPPISTTDCARGLAVLEKTNRVAPEATHLHLLRARLALLEGKPDEFAGHVNAWVAASGKFSEQPFDQPGARYPLDALERWRKKAGDAAADAAIAKIESPVLRCIFSRDAKPEQRIARVNRELAALPKDAPVETRRALTRLKWSFHARGEAVSGALRKELEAAVADDSDPRLTFEAKWQLISSALREGEMAADDKLKLKELLTKLATSPDPGDQAYAAQFGGYFGGSLRSTRLQNPPVAATRWGLGNNFSSSNSRQNRLTLPAIVAMDDKDQATREAARFLESAARASAGRAGNLSDEIKALSDAGLVDGACDRISLPADAGLGRRVAILTLLDACAKTDRARSLLAEIAKSRPWETRWTVDLALRSPDDAEMHRLLDSVAERGDFDRIMGELLSQDRAKTGELLSRLTRLVAWAPQAKGHRAWMQPAMMILAKGGSGGLQELAAKNEDQLACFRRYVELALDDRRLGELGFRVMFAARRVATLEAVTAAAHRALLSGAYASAGRTFATGSMQGDMELAALEHLVLVAAEKGDEAAFPADFRQRLKIVDPESAAWLAKMLAAKAVTELPDVSNARAKSAGWVALARHEAAMLRAIKLPGRDAWLTEVFRRNEFQSLSQNLRHIIRQSLLDAGNPETLRDRVLALLEASAGPRKDWEKQPPKIDPTVPKVTPIIQLPQAAAVILHGAKETNAATLLAVLDIFRETRVPVGDPGSAFARLGQWWQQEMTPPRKSTLAELLGQKRDAAYTLGVWQAARVPGGKPLFHWQLPQVLQRLPIPGRDELAKAVKDNPDAGFLDLFQVGLGTNDRALQRRTLLKAAPDLAKLPAEIRHAVIDYLTTGMGAQDLKGLPAQAAAQLRENLDTARKQRIEAARLTYNRMKSGPSHSANQSYQLGSMLGPVIADDDAFVAEVLAAWRPQAEADKSGKETEAFMGGLVSNTAQGLEAAMSALRLLDLLTQGSPPFQRNSNWGDPMENLRRKLGHQPFRDPELWRQTAALSPKIQAQFWLGATQYVLGHDLGADPKLVESFRDAAKGGEVTRAALEWFLQSNPTQRDENSKVDGAALLGFAKALKEADASASHLAELLCNSYTMLPRMHDPRAVMAETPALLAGLKSFPDEGGAKLFQGIESLWKQVQRDHHKAPGGHFEAVETTPVYPVETAELLKFAFTRGLNPLRYGAYGPRHTPMVLATGDAELLDLWIKFAGNTLAGDLPLIIMLLEKDRVPEAVALAPAAGRSFSSSRGFTSHLESLMPKLNSIPQAFALMARLSLLSDASGAEAPAEQYAARKARLTAEFERIRDSLTVADRAAFCLSQGLKSPFDQKHVPTLDEFASEQGANEFKKLLLTGGRDSSVAVAQLFIPAVCSRVFADDLSGIALLTTVIAAVPPGPRRASSDFQSTIYPIHRCLAAYANRHDAKLPNASGETILAYAAALADRKNPLYQGIVAQYVYLAATDPASLAAGLKTCGLDGQKPIVYNANGGYSFTLETYQAMMRVALLHPTASEALLASLGPPLNNGATTGALLPSLHDPKLRARMTPALFLKWNSDLWAMTPKDREAIQLYATERRGDFDDAQRTQLDELLRELEERDPARVREMRRRKMEEPQLLNEREKGRRMQE